jgi:secreted PhoX family phosphatase
MTQPRRLLPIVGAALRGHFGRSASTCLYRCGNACDHPEPNESDNQYFGDLVQAEVSRRGVMRGGAIGAVVLGGLAAAGPAVAAPADPDADAERDVPDPAELAKTGGPAALGFKAIPPNRLDSFIVPNGYDHAVVVRWGDEVVPGAPAFDVYKQSAERQKRQFGYNNDFVGVLPLHGKDRALLVCNQEYTNPELMFPGFTATAALTVEQWKIIQAAVGMTVVEIERVGRTGEWQLVRNGRRLYNRRVTASDTRFAFTGPAAGHDLLKTAADRSGTQVIGTFANCSGGVTPWGTVLSGEENFNTVFVGANGAPEAAKPGLKRYGFDTVNRGAVNWESADERFDLSKHPNEANRFGWVVELDPFDPRSTPRKHTAMGRLKHEGANVIVAKDSRVVAYTGDDERFDYLYKFVSHRKMYASRAPWARKHNLTLLESGDLYVAKFDGNGRGTWLPLVKDNRSRVEGMTVPEVLILTRLAADRLGATKMDRPEDVEPNPKTGKVYCALTNNTRRGVGTDPGVDPVNPRVNNKHGQILEITEDDGDNAAETFSWRLPIICGDPTDPSTYFLGFDKSKVSPISCPDNVAFDASGNLWIATDGNALEANDGLFAVPLEGPDAGHLKQFLSVPFGAETCGPFITGDGRSVFTAVQHPGEREGARVENPASTWPDGDFAKPGIAVTWKLDNGAVGA